MNLKIDVWEECKWQLANSNWQLANPFAGSGFQVLLIANCYLLIATLRQHDAVVIQPVGQRIFAAAGKEDEFDADAAFRIDPHDLALAFDRWAGRKFEGELHGRARFKCAERTDRHPVLAHIRAESAMLNSLMRNRNRTDRGMAEISAAHLFH